MSPSNPVRLKRRSSALGLLSLLGLAGCMPARRPRLVPLPPVSQPEPPPLSQRRREREALLKAARERLLARAEASGRVVTHLALGDRMRRLAGPLVRAAQAVRAEALANEWPIDVLVGSEGADVIPLLPVSLVIVLPLNPPGPRSDDLLSALIAHGLAHGLRDHALEADTLKDGLPWFSAIQEREADRDTCEILARSGLDPMLAWRLRDALAQAHEGSQSNSPSGGDSLRGGAGRTGERSGLLWTLRHPDPPRAQQAITSFAARVEPLRAAAAAVR